MDGIYSRWKLGGNVLFAQLNSSQPNIKLTIEVNLSKVLDTKLTNINGNYKFNVYRKNIKGSSPWTSKTPHNTINQIQLMVVFIAQKEYYQTLTKKSLWQKESLWRLINHSVSLTLLRFIFSSFHFVVLFLIALDN